MVGEASLVDAAALDMLVEKRVRLISFFKTLVKVTSAPNALVKVTSGTRGPHRGREALGRAVSVMAAQWKHPWTCTLSGPTGCGKTVFVKRFLKHLERTSDTRFERVILYYGEWQSGYKELGANVEFREGLPQSSDWSGDPRPKLIIIDDLMRESSGGSGAIVNLFTKGSHHNNLSVIFITQNIFHQGKGQRDISLNAQYIVIFRNLRDRAQIQHLARQVCPENPKFLQEAYWDATSQPYGYLLLDLKQDTPDNCRFRTNIFPDDDYQYVYVPRNQRMRGSDSQSLVPILSL